MRRIVLGLVNFLSALGLVFGLFLLKASSMDSNAMAVIRQASYSQSDEINAQLTEDITDFFSFIDLRNVFENHGTLDLNQVIAQAEKNGQPVSYSLNYLIQYARSAGYYLDDKNSLQRKEGSSDEDNTSVRVTYRAYLPDFKPSSPADELMSLSDLAEETLQYLSRYYSLRQKFLDTASNLKFYLSYSHEDHQTCVTNLSMDGISAEDTGARTQYAEKQIRDLGLYLLTGSDTMELNTNFASVPSNLVPLLQARNPYNEGTYSFCLGVDLNFPESDRYQTAAHRYGFQRAEARLGAALFLMFGVVALVTMVLLFIYTGRDGRKIRLYRADSTPVEVLAGIFALWVFLVWHITPNLLESVENIMGPLETWDFWESAIDWFSVYLVLTPLLLSVVRNYRAEMLWENCLCRRAVGFCRRVMNSTAGQSRPRIYNILLFAVPNILSLVFIIMLFYRFGVSKSLMSFLAALVMILVLAALDSYIYSISAGLSKAVAEQVKSERLKAELITNVSHDLKTPLTSIISYVDLMKREPAGSPRMAEYISVLDQKAHRLKTMTEDLVEASKASTGNIRIDPARIDFAEITIQALGEFDDKFEKAGLTVVENVPDKPEYILADGRHLWRVLENLFNNCCKYALRGSRVYVDLTEAEDGITVSVKNISSMPLNMSPEELTERFVRGDVSRTTEGSGLGLSIAKSLTELMKGELQIVIDGDLFKALIRFPKAPVYLAAETKEEETENSKTYVSAEADSIPGTQPIPEELPRVEKVELIGGENDAVTNTQEIPDLDELLKSLPEETRRKIEENSRKSREGIREEEQNGKKS